MPVTVGLGLSLASTIYGGIKQAQAAKSAKANLANRPKYAPLPEDDSELNLAESQANLGMGAGARQTLLNNNQNNTAGITNAILMGGGDANSIASAVDKSQQGLNNLAIYDDEARQRHLGTLLSSYRSYANQRQSNADKQFQINEYAPWADRQQLYTQQQQAGENLMMHGISTLGNSLMSFKKKSPGNDIQLSRSTPEITRLPISGDNEAPPMGMAPYYQVPEMP